MSLILKMSQKCQFPNNKHLTKIRSSNTDVYWTARSWEHWGVGLKKTKKNNERKCRISSAQRLLKIFITVTDVSVFLLEKD